MSYQVLARKWRPRDFSEMVGQAHVVRALSNALDTERLHHAYLFTGTRGVGKTTLARILAKSLNCETGVTATPCGECSSCTEIDEGRFVDLLEVDAASRTKVDQTRELLEQVPYAPVRGRYKVYLIDEVHMFSDSSFNALLKTLEEPPPHVKFLLATTDPQKVPVTVLSRCLQFNLKRLPEKQIVEQFSRILQAEAVPFDPPALAVLARAADGSMRDGLSLLDQAIAFCGGEVREAPTREMLGAIAVDRLPDLLRAVHSGAGATVLDMVEELSRQSPDFAGVLKDLLALLHRLAVVQAVPDVADPEDDDGLAVRSLADELPAEDVQLYYQIGLLGTRDLPLAPDPRSGFEMTLLRMLAFRPTPAEAAAEPPHQHSAQSLPSKGNPEARETMKAQLAESSAAAVALDEWHVLVPQLALGGLALQLANNCAVDRWDGQRLELAVDPRCAGFVGSKAQAALHAALNDWAGREVELRISVREPEQQTPAQRAAKAQEQTRQEAITSMQNDPVVQALEEKFDAELILDSVKSVTPSDQHEDSKS
jgi:DNA polymerase-3 subunit gamma/tau